jgi:hypothetical protein
MSVYEPIVPDCEEACRKPKNWVDYNCEQGAPYNTACYNCTSSFFTLNNTGVRYQQGVEKLQVFEKSNPNASLVLANNITKSSEKLLVGVIQRYLTAGYEGSYIAESIIKFKQEIFNANMIAQSFVFTKFTAPSIPPPPRGRLA